MTNTEIIDFYENIDKLTSFKRIRTVYDLTNDLDLNLLRFLRKDFFMHHLLKIKAEVYLHSDVDSKDIEQVYDTLLDGDYYMYFIEDTIETFCEFIDKSFIDGFLDKITHFFPELNMLTRISYTKVNRSQTGDEKVSSELYEGLMDEFNVPIIRRILYLEKLGVIDFLKKERPFNTSINSMANILGHIIDAKPSSIQPLLNPLLSNDVDNKNNPLNSAKNVMAVEAHLMKIGYSIKNGTDN